MILMKGSAVANAALELNIVLQNELNMTRWDGKNRTCDLLVNGNSVNQSGKFAHEQLGFFGYL